MTRRKSTKSVTGSIPNKVLKETIYKKGYVIRLEEVDMVSFGGPNSKPLLMKTAYTPNGDYIGDVRWASRLIRKRGIIPQLISPDHKVCSIGYSPKDGKWYGWSHRAICGFRVGSMVKMGHVTEEYLPVGFVAKNITDMKIMAIAFARSVS